MSHLIKNRLICNNLISKKSFSISSFLSSHDPIVVVDCLRSPIGSFKSSLSSLSATSLASQVIKALVARFNSASSIDEAIFGSVISSNGGQAPTRQAVLKAGLPLSVITSTINKVCASGMKAIMFSAQSLQLNHQNIMIAGGFESMSNVPYYLKRDSLGYGHVSLIDGILADGLLDSFLHIHMGNCGENTAKKLKISRNDQDEYAIKSYEKATAAAKAGLFNQETTPIQIKDKKGEVITVIEDEEYKKFDLKKFKNLKTVFQKENGTITAGNASKLNDGAAACILMKQSTSQKLEIKPLAKIVDFADYAVEPIDFPIAPVGAIQKILTRKQINKEDITMWEINEAFSVVPLAVAKLVDIDLKKVNINGGAISLGHPIGMSGARIVNSLALHLKPGSYGMAAICNGGGGASAILLQKL